MKIINLAVIAHVDAGKSTLVDGFLNQSGTFQSHQVVEELIMDSDAIEKERGITIYSKNCSVFYKDYKINIVDTPGHADFSSEVERIISTVDTVILLVDSAEGPMPQTRFVLQKSLQKGLKPILLINKIDKKDARIAEVVDEVYELFMDLNATEQQLEFPILYGIAKQGIVIKDLDSSKTNMEDLFETIIHHSESYPDLSNEPLRLQISALAYDDYIGRLGIGRLYSGNLTNNNLLVCDDKGYSKNISVSNIFVYEGLNRVKVDKVATGDIVVVAGIDDISIGQTICERNNPLPMPSIEIEEPTLTMNFMVNKSPLAGREGKFVTSRNIKERLDKELEVNVGLRVEALPENDSFKVSGRGELHLSILIENMRREGYELAISKPQVIYKRNNNGELLEPIEEVIVIVHEEYSGNIIASLNLRKGIMIDMNQENSYVKLIYHVPTRGLIGYRSIFINETKGEGTLVRRVIAYERHKGEISSRTNGVFISNCDGRAMTYSLFNLQERGQMLINPQTEVYEGMIVGINSRDNDLEVNPTKNKKLTSIRSAGADEAMRLVPPKIMNLEEALEFIAEDELVEVTPKHIRLRKKYLKAHERKNAYREQYSDN